MTVELTEMSKCPVNGLLQLALHEGLILLPPLPLIEGNQMGEGYGSGREQERIRNTIKRDLGWDLISHGSEIKLIKI